MSGRITGGRWSGTSCFLTEALPGGLTVFLSFCLAPFFLELVAVVEPTATLPAVLAAAEPTGDDV